MTAPTVEQSEDLRRAPVSCWLSGWEKSAVDQAARLAGLNRSEWMRVVVLRASRDLLTASASDVGGR